jgi:hypothetical protein
VTLHPAAIAAVFIHHDPDSRGVIFTELAHSCRAAHEAETGEPWPLTFRLFRAELRAAGFKVSHPRNKIQGKRRTLVVHASWNDPALAEEAESARITAETN